MMQEVQCSTEAAQADYRPRQNVADSRMSGAEVDAIYPKPSLELMYRQSLSFVDPNQLGYQVYPGFELDMPRL